MRPRLMTEYSVRKMLVKPRLGKRRWSGIWPPSKPRIMWEPERERWPLWPRVEVLPMPEPIPRPTRFLPVLAFLGARKLERFFAMIFLAIAPSGVIQDDSRLWELAFENPNQVRDGLDHAADGFVVDALDDLVQPREAEPLNDELVLERCVVLRAKVLNANL